MKFIRYIGSLSYDRRIHLLVLAISKLLINPVRESFLGWQLLESLFISGRVNKYFPRRFNLRIVGGGG